MRRMLTRILFLAVPATLGCSSDGPNTGNGTQFLSPNCSTHVHFTVAVDGSKATPQMQLRIESCRLDVDACPDMCGYQMYQLSQLPANGWVNPNNGMQVFNGGDTGGAPPELGVPVGGGSVGIPPVACKVTFDGNTVNSEFSYDQPTFGAGCAEAGISGGSGTAGGVK